MQMMALNRALIPQVTGLSKRRPQTRSQTREQFKNDDDFTPLSSTFGDVIEAEFEEMGDEAASFTASKRGYFNVLFPEFLLKSRYVNYYL